VTARRREGGSIARPVELGTAELVPDTDRPGGWTLLVDGVPQSYVDTTDPTFLEFEYMRRLASVVDTAAAPGAPLDVLHLGGGALTLPRYVAATRPGSRQRVVERDTALSDFVARLLPLPDGVDVEVTAGDAREAVEALPDAGYDLLIADVYRAAQMPRSVASVQFADQAARILRRRGRYVANVADLPPLAFSRVQAATLRAVFPDVCVIAEPRLLRGRRYGNVVLVAANNRGGLPVGRLRAAALRDPFPGRVLHATALDRFVDGADPADDAAAGDSPAPPPRLLI
jgi:spermidine synthase